MAAKERTPRSKSPQSFDTDLRQTEVTTYSNRAQAREGNIVKAVGTAVRKPVIAADKSDKYTSFAPQKYVNDYSDLVKFGGEMAIDAYKGYKEAEAETEIEGTLKDYFDGQIADAAIPGATADKVNAELRMNDNYGDDRDPGEYSESDEQTLKEATDNLHQLARLKQRGAKSSTELNVKVEALVRKYINQVPGLATEFRNIAKNTLGDSEATLNRLISQEKSEAVIAKEQRMAYNNLLANANKEGFTGTDREKILQLAEWNQEKHLVARQKLLLERDENAAKALTTRDGWGTFSKVTSRNLTSALTAAVNNPANSSIDRKLVAIQLVMSDIAGTVSGQLGNTAGGKELLSGLNAIRDVYVGMANGSIPAEAANNMVTYVTKTIEAKLWSNPELARDLIVLKFAGNTLTANTAAARVVKGLESISVDVENLTVTQLAATAGGPPAFGPGTTEAQKALVRKLTADNTLSYIKAYGKETSPEFTAAHKRFMSSMINSIENWEESAGVEAMDALVKTTADESMVNFLALYDTDGRYREQAKLMVQSFIGKSIDSRMKEKFDSSTMEIRPASDGTSRVFSLSNNPTKETTKQIQVLNESYMPRLNSYFRAYEHLNGGTDYAGAGEQYFRKLFNKGLGTTTDKDKTVRDDIVPSLISKNLLTIPEHPRFASGEYQGARKLLSLMINSDQGGLTGTELRKNFNWQAALDGANESLFKALDTLWESLRIEGTLEERGYVKERTGEANEGVPATTTPLPDGSAPVSTIRRVPWDAQSLRAN